MRFRPILTSLGMTGLMILPWSVPAAGSPVPASSLNASAVAADQEPTPADVAFVESAHRANLAEIAVGRTAWLKTTDATVKSLAATIMRDHIHLDAALYDTARELRISLPAEPSTEQQALNRRYEAAGADQFDEYFISTQLAGHRESLEMIDAHLGRDGNEAVRALAESARPVIAGHRDQFREAAGDKGLPGYGEGGGRG